jgi:hypothetical protein
LELRPICFDIGYHDDNVLPQPRHGGSARRVDRSALMFV